MERTIKKNTIYYRKDSNNLGAEKGSCVALVLAEGVALHRETSLLTISWSEFTWSSRYLLQTGLAPWEFEFPFPGSLWSNFQVLYTHIVKLEVSVVEATASPTVGRRHPTKQLDRGALQHTAIPPEWRATSLEACFALASNLKPVCSEESLNLWECST